MKTSNRYVELVLDNNVPGLLGLIAAQAVLNKLKYEDLFRLLDVIKKRQGSGSLPTPLLDAVLLLLIGLTFQEEESRPSCFSSVEWQSELVKCVTPRSFRSCEEHFDHAVGAILTNCSFDSVLDQITKEHFKLITESTFLPYATKIIEAGDRDLILRMLGNGFSLEEEYDPKDPDSRAYCTAILNLCESLSDDEELLIALIDHMSPFADEARVSKFLLKTARDSADYHDIRLHQCCLSSAMLTAISIPSEIQKMAARHVVKLRYSRRNQNTHYDNVYDSLADRYAENTLGKDVVSYLQENEISFD